MTLKAFPAFACIEFGSVPAGIFAADALLKRSPISMIRSGTIGAGRYLILVAGTTASVEEAHEEALYHGGLQVEDSVFLPDIHPALHQAILGNTRRMGEGPIWVLETPTVACNLQATERALKGVAVELLEFRAGDPRMNGRGLSILQGDLYDLEAAQEMALAMLETRGIPVQHRILTSPHESLLAQLANSTRFDQSPPVQLEGESAS
ncbi:MAG: BMC domain-containing protein [Verrucomicrobiota bacterium]|jgi:microcompartment protein CcmL/EutN|nr:BMC domain-containing protein [Verrucomicrobiota bacterium]